MKHIDDENDLDEYDKAKRLLARALLFLILLWTAILAFTLLTPQAGASEKTTSRRTDPRLLPLARFFSSFYSEPARSRPMLILIEPPGAIPSDTGAFITRTSDDAEGCTIHLRSTSIPSLLSTPLSSTEPITTTLAHEVCHCMIDYPWIDAIGWRPKTSRQARNSMEYDAEKCSERLVGRLAETEGRGEEDRRAQKIRDDFAAACRNRSALEGWSEAEERRFKEYARREVVRVLDSLVARGEMRGLDMRSFVLGLALPAADSGIETGRSK